MAGSGVRRFLQLTAAVGILTLISALTACKKQEAAAPQEIRPVRTVTVEPKEAGETVSLTGEIQPRYQADLGFRVRGKILQRPVDVGTQVKKGDLLARLDPQQYSQDLEVAKAEVAKADAEVTRSRNQEYRQSELLKKGFTTQVAYDQAVKTFKTAEAEAEAARAKQTQASENLGYTDLLGEGQVVMIPGSALFQKDGQPAVWLVTKDGTVQLKPITVARYQGDSVVVGDGLGQGDIVVTGGVQKLLPGQKVRLMQASAG